jgi:hypothetical protein
MKAPKIAGAPNKVTNCKPKTAKKLLTGMWDLDLDRTTSSYL